MGDNRPESCDSRYWGPIRESTIAGKVDMRIWPLTRIGFF
jgi:signal peptidase I